MKADCDNDEEGMYGEHVASRLRKLSKQQKALAYIEIDRLFYSIEFGPGAFPSAPYASHITHPSPPSMQPHHTNIQPHPTNMMQPHTPLSQHPSPPGMQPHTPLPQNLSPTNMLPHTPLAIPQDFNAYQELQE